MISNLDSERAVIGWMLTDDALAREGLEELIEPMFFDDRNRLIFASLVNLASVKSPLDVATLWQELKANGKQIESGGREYVSGVAKMAVCADHFQHHITQVKRSHFAREMVRLAQGILNDPDDESIFEAMQRVSLARDASAKTGVFDFSKDMPGFLSQLEAKRENDKPVYLGIDNLDGIIGGVRPGDLLTISARPGGGKTALMARIALNMAARGNRVLVFPTEMTTEQYVCRLISAEAKIENYLFRRGELRTEHFEKINEVARVWHGNTQLFSCENPKPSLADINRMMGRVKPTVVIVDYLQRCSRPKAENHTRSIDYFMCGLKSLGVENRCCMVLGCQMNRGVDHMAGDPRLSDLRDSGSIEAESDQVILLRPKQPKNAEDHLDKFRHIQAFVEKNRHGGLGICELLLEKAIINISEGPNA